MKFLILLAYYERPRTVRNALISIRDHGYDDFELVVFDDGSELPARPVVEEIFGDDRRVRVVELEETVEEKLMTGGSMIGQRMNLAMAASGADVVLIVCDDDALYPGYLEGLAAYYAANPDVNYAFSHLVCYDSDAETPEKIPLATTPSRQHPLNYTTPQLPKGCFLHAGQVSWRRGPCIESGIGFDFPRTVSLDEHLFRAMQDHWGEVMPTGLIGEWVSIATTQLTRRLKHGDGYGRAEK